MMVLHCIAFIHCYRIVAIYVTLFTAVIMKSYVAKFAVEDTTVGWWNGKVSVDVVCDQILSLFSV